MGSKSLAPWKPPHHSYTTFDTGYCKVWVRVKDRLEQLEQYPVFIHNQQQLTNFQDIFAMRLNNRLLVSAVYFTHQPGRMCQIYQTGSILLQRIPYRLCQFSQFPQQYAVSILYIVLQSCQQLYCRFGLLKISTTMIGLDTNWMIKVWHNTDLSSATPQNQYCRSLQQMIEHVIKSVENLAMFSPKHPSFLKFIEQNRFSFFNFPKTLQYLQIYCQQYMITRIQTFPFLKQYIQSIQNFQNMYIEQLQKNYINKIKENQLKTKSKYIKDEKQQTQINKKQYAQEKRSKSKYSFKSKSLIKTQSKSPEIIHASYTHKFSEYYQHVDRNNSNQLRNLNNQISQRFRGKIKQTIAIAGDNMKEKKYEGDEELWKRPISTTARNSSSYHSLDHSFSSRNNHKHAKKEIIGPEKTRSRIFLEKQHNNSNKVHRPEAQNSEYQRHKFEQEKKKDKKYQHILTISPKFSSRVEHRQRDNPYGINLKKQQIRHREQSPQNKSIQSIESFSITGNTHLVNYFNNITGRN